MRAGILACLAAVLCLLLAACGMPRIGTDPSSEGGVSQTLPGTSVPSGSATALDTDSATEKGTTTGGNTAGSSSSLPDDPATSSESSGTTTGTGSAPTASDTETSAADTTTSAVTTGTTRPADKPVVAPVTKEFRAVWVSYIELNALLKGKNAEQAKAALDGMMDNCADFGMTAVVLHVRANSDAYYVSSVYPAAAAVKPLLDAGFDPLAYAVSAAHSRGLELHAWINPYRVGRDASNARCADTFTYGDKTYYIPTSEAVKALILNGIRELVRGYALDGVQFDDYFYPTGCAEEGSPAAFEKTAYEAYREAAGASAMTPGGWRRSHVDSLVAAACNIVHGRKNCLFGISPSHDASKTHDQMFADSKKWLATAGYVDYLCPQVYFGFDHDSSAFDKVTAEWLAYTRSPSVSLYFGLGVYKTGLSPDRYAGSGSGEWGEDSGVLADSVLYLRQQKVTGMLFYSYSYFFEDTARDLQQWTADGTTVVQSYNPGVAKQAVEKLRQALAAGNT